MTWTHRMLVLVQWCMCFGDATPRLERIEEYLIRRYNRD